MHGETLKLIIHSPLRCKQKVVLERRKKKLLS